jgi:hypothetical protein
MVRFIYSIEELRNRFQVEKIYLQLLRGFKKTDKL